MSSLQDKLKSGNPVYSGSARSKSTLFPSSDRLEMTLGSREHCVCIDLPRDREQGYAAIVFAIRPSTLVFVKGEDYPPFPVIGSSATCPGLLYDLRQRTGHGHLVTDSPRATADQFS